MVNNRDEIYLSDFGLSVFIEGRRKRYASLHGGAHQWLPPEAFLTAEAKDFRSTTYADVYSFACVCIEVKCLYFLFETLDVSDYLTVPHGQRSFRVYFPSRNGKSDTCRDSARTTDVLQDK